MAGRLLKRVVSSVAVVIAFGCLSTAEPPARSAPVYPTFIVLGVNDSYAVPAVFGQGTSRSVDPARIAALVASSNSTVVIMGRAPGFAEWNPKLAGFHNIEIAVVDSTNGPILVAHHGVPLVAPENTLAGVRAACELGIPGVEVDVRFTRDSVPVLLHDRDIGRTSNGSGFVDQTGLLQLKALDFGSWFNSAYAGEPIPTLVEFLMEARACGFRLVQLDVKSYAPVGIDSGWMRIARAVQAESLFSKTDFGGPDLNILQRGRTLTPGAHTVLFVLSVTQPLADAVIAAHVDGVGVSFDGYALSSDVLSHLDSLGIRIGVYAPPSVLSVNGLSPFPKIVTTDWDWRLVN